MPLINKDTFFSGATAAAPAANTTIVSLGTQNPGDFRLKIVTLQAVSPDANLLNIELREPNNTIAILPSLSTQFSVTMDRIQFAGVGTVLLRTGAAVGGAGAIYMAFAQLVRIG